LQNPRKAKAHFSAPKPESSVKQSFACKQPIGKVARKRNRASVESIVNGSEHVTYIGTAISTMNVTATCESAKKEQPAETGDSHNKHQMAKAKVTANSKLIEVTHSFDDTIHEYFIDSLLCAGTI
jgi:hypothetical protein